MTMGLILYLGVCGAVGFETNPLDGDFPALRFHAGPEHLTGTTETKGTKDMFP